MLWGALVLTLCNLVGTTATSPPATGLAHWWQRMHQELDARVQQRQIAPPVPRTLRWRPSRIWSGELQGELVDMVAGDLNNDGTSELYALTTEKLVVLSRARGLFDVRSQHELPAELASMRSRDPIGSARVSRHEGVPTLRVRTSEQEQGASYQLINGALVKMSESTGYPLCQWSSIEAAPGRNFFVGSSVVWSEEDAPLSEYALEAALYSVRCSRNTVDPSGHPLTLLSEVSSARRLRLRCLGNEEFCQANAREFEDVGYAHLVADINNDGSPELITSSTSLPGTPDRVSVRTLEPGRERVLFEESFSGGIVAIAAGDFDGDDSLSLVVAVRKQNKVSLWLLN